MRNRHDLMEKAREGLAADVLALLLSEASWPVRLARHQWEPVLFDQARVADTEVASIELGDCPFPELLRRRNFFDNRATFCTAGCVGALVRMPVRRTPTMKPAARTIQKAAGLLLISRP